MPIHNSLGCRGTFTLTVSGDPGHSPYLPVANVYTQKIGTSTWVGHACGNWNGNRVDASTQYWLVKTDTPAHLQIQIRASSSCSGMTLSLATSGAFSEHLCWPSQDTSGFWFCGDMSADTAGFSVTIGGC